MDVTGEAVHWPSLIRPQRYHMLLITAEIRRRIEAAAKAYRTNTTRALPIYYTGGTHSDTKKETEIVI